MQSPVWQEYACTLRELLGLETHPVAVNCIKNKTGAPDKGRSRICRAILDAAAGKTVEISKNTNACFGATWHLGFQRIEDPAVRQMTKKFVVEGEKLFASYEALENLIAEMGDAPDNSQSTFLLRPLEKAEEKPELVVFVCNPEQACRLLTFVTFFDGKSPKIKIGGPTCRMAIMYPLLQNEVNISFQDYTARKMTQMPKDQLLVTIPYERIPRIIDVIDKCSAGRAKVEFPQEFREFLQKRTKVA